MYYLKRLIIILEEINRAGLFGGIYDELNAVGIEMLIMDIRGQYFLPDGNRDSDMLKYRVPAAYEILWITDSGIVADYLIENHCKVLAYFHEKNGSSGVQGVPYAFEKPEDLTVQYLDRIYRRYAKIPWDILDTERCHIRETVESDIEEFYSIYAEPSITEHMEDLYEDRDAERAYIREYIDKIYGFYEFGVWTVIEKESGQVIGRAGLSYREGFEEPELGFVIGVPWQGKGYAFEVCAAILDYGREELGFENFQALVEPGNVPSLRLCDKLGFKKERIINISGVDYVKMTL